jgi:hypothetical protein
MHCTYILALAVVAMVLATASSGPTRDAERDALVNLYWATGGPSWHNNQNWLVGDPCNGAWFGLRCTGDANYDTRSVFDISLNDNNLRGEFYDMDAFMVFGALQKFSVRKNALSGTIPNMPTTVTTLDASQNKFVYMKGFAQKSVNVSHNQMEQELDLYCGSWSYPNRNLETLDLSYNKFTYTKKYNIFEVLENCINLRYILLQNNSFTGFIPSLVWEPQNHWLNVGIGACDATNNNWHCPVPDWATPCHNGTLSDQGAVSDSHAMNIV